MILRDYCVNWIIGWVACWIALMFVFFTSWKTVLKSWLDTFHSLLSVELPKPFSYRNLDSSSILGGSIENAPTSSIASRHLVDRSSFRSWIWFLVARYLLDTSVVDDHFLDTYLDRFLNTSWHLRLSRFIEGLYILSSWSISHFFNLSRSVRACSSPKHSLFHSKPFPWDFSSLFQVFPLLVSF